MKKRTFLYCLSAIILVACSKENIYPDVNNGEDLHKIEFSASIQETKTILQGTKVLWCPGDQISVSGAQDPFVTDLQDVALAAKFSGMAASPSNGTYYAAYPYAAVTEWDDATVIMSLPVEQNPVVGTFENGLNFSVASTTAENKSFAFHNILSYISFIIPEGDEAINTVKLSSTNFLSGIFKVNVTDGTTTFVTGKNDVVLHSEMLLKPGKYYMAVLPKTNTNDIS